MSFLCVLVLVLSLDHGLEEFCLFFFIQVSIVLVRICQNLLCDSLFDDLDSVVLKFDVRKVVFLGLSFIEPRLEAVFTIVVIYYGLVKSLGESLLVHPVVTDSGFNLI